MLSRKVNDTKPFVFMMLLNVLGLISCGDGASFKSGTTSSSADVGESDSSTIPPIETPHSDDGTAGTNSPPPTTGGETDLKDMSPEKCAEWLGGKPEDVIKFRKGSKLALTENSILYIDLFGRTTIDLTSDSTSSIKGLCIRSTKLSEASIQVGFSVEKLAYYGRLSGSTDLNFTDGASLKSLIHDLSDDHVVHLTGTNLDCGSVDLGSQKSATMTCQN